MSHYSNDESMVRVDFFKPSGKWYTAETMQWQGYNGEIHDEFQRSLENHLQGRLQGMTAVCLQPYNKHSHPLMARVPE